MIRKAAFSAIIACLLMLLAPVAVRAASGPAVLDSSVAVDFPASITFSISAESDVAITDVRLHYSVVRMAHAEVTSEIYLEFTPAKSVSEEWVWDMRMTGGLPAGSSVTYWWTVADAQGERTATEPADVLIEDNRYDWNSLTEGGVTLYWYQGGDAFAGALMAASQQALSRLKDSTGAALEKPVEIYIYASAGDLQGAMIYPQEWAGGVAFTPYGIVAIGIAPSALDWGIGAIAHELTHLVVYQVTFNAYSSLPTWLDEGLAMNGEGELQPYFATFLEQAVAAGTLTSVRSLSSPFSAYAEESYLSYAESYSIVKYLIDTYGRDKMFALLATFRQGSTYDGALEKVYGFDMDGLDARWRDDIGASAPTPQTSTPTLTVTETETAIPAGPVVPPVLVVVLAVLCAGLLLCLVLLIRGGVWRRKR